MRYPLPYAFARTHRLLLEEDGQNLSLFWCESSDRSALSEVMRKFAAQDLRMQHGLEADLVQRINQAYSGGQAHSSSSAAAVVNLRCLTAGTPDAGGALFPRADASEVFALRIAEEDIGAATVAGLPSASVNFEIQIW
mgnify:CR=1 FL=1